MGDSLVEEEDMVEWEVEEVMEVLTVEDQGWVVLVITEDLELVEKEVGNLRVCHQNRIDLVG